MNLLLKIIEGPNKGAEAALVEGVPVTLGKGDDCDILLVDATMPNKTTVSATTDGVTLDGEPLPLLHVKTLGATSLAVGPADEPWGPLVWNTPETQPAPQATPAVATEKSPEAALPAKDAKDAKKSEEKKKEGGHGFLYFLIFLLIVLIVLGWWMRDDIKREYARFTNRGNGCPSAQEVSIFDKISLSEVASKYHLKLEDNTLSGNFATRSERLAATAEAYSAQPGVELDLSDDESFHAAAADALFVLTEGALKVADAKDRTLTLSGAVGSSEELNAVLKALSTELPKMQKVDASEVLFSAGQPALLTASEPTATTPVATPRARRTVAASSPAVTLPICGILTKPFPCLVLRDGRRVFEGAEIGGATIVRIEADTVVLSDANGKEFSWKP